MSTSCVFLAKKGLFPELFNSSEGSSVGINATRNINIIIIIKHRTLSIVTVFRASKPKEVNHLRTAPFLDIWAPFYHHGNGDAAVPAHPRYLKFTRREQSWHVASAGGEIATSTCSTSTGHSRLSLEHWPSGTMNLLLRVSLLVFQLRLSTGKRNGHVGVVVGKC